MPWLSLWGNGVALSPTLTFFLLDGILFEMFVCLSAFSGKDRHPNGAIPGPPSRNGWLLTDHGAGRGGTILVSWRSPTSGVSRAGGDFISS